MDPQQLESLYDAFAPAVHAFALQLTRHEEASKDLLQNVFMRLARRPAAGLLGREQAIQEKWRPWKS